MRCGAAREDERIGCGPEGFISIQRDPWFRTVDWAQLLRKQTAVPWLPPVSEDGAAPSDAELNPDGVMADVPFSEKTWGPIFESFGQTISTPPELGMDPTPSTHQAVA